MELKIKTVNTMTGSDGSQYGKFTVDAPWKAIWPL